MDIAARAESYNTKFDKWPRLTVDKGFLLGTWMIGNYYKNDTDFYGAYPHGYIGRILALFPDMSPQNILHLFSGSLKPGTGIRFDINPALGPDIVGSAETLSSCPELAGHDIRLIMADPPYSDEDATHYGTPMVNRNKVVAECAKVLKPGGFLVWLDQAFPMYRKTELKLKGTIGLIRSTNHRVRMTFIWERI